MGYGNGPILEFDQDRLTVLDIGPAAGGVSNMADAHRPPQEGDLGVVKNLGDKAHAPMGAYGLAVVHRYACRLLPPVLQGIEGIINGLSYIIARLIEGNSDNAAGIVQLSAPSSLLFSSTWHFASWPSGQIRIERKPFS
jgi:hypothetical protein